MIGAGKRTGIAPLALTAPLPCVSVPAGKPAAVSFGSLRAPRFSALWFILFLVLSLCLPVTRIWAFSTKPQSAFGVLASATPSSIRGDTIARHYGPSGFLYDGTELVAKQDNLKTGKPITRRHFAQWETRSGGADAGSYYYTRDHLGSVRELTDASGTLRARYDYELWGASSTNKVIAANAVPGRFDL